MAERVTYALQGYGCFYVLRSLVVVSNTQFIHEQHFAIVAV